MWPLIIAGAALGAYKGREDMQQSKRDREQAATTAQWSPWTGMQPGQIRNGSMAGGALQGGLAGASFGQNLSSANGGGGGVGTGGESNPTGYSLAGNGAEMGPPKSAMMTGDYNYAGNGADMGPPRSAMAQKPVVAAPQAQMPYAQRSQAASMGSPPWLMMQNQRTYGG